MGTDQYFQQKSGNCNKNKFENLHHGWKYLPTEPLIQIFKLLGYKDLGCCSLACKRWFEIGNLNFLWQRRFRLDFKIGEMDLRPNGMSWKSEYQRMVDLVPSVEFERILEHDDEVLHVAFSNNGMMFCTCSKDASVKVFSADWPFDTIFNEHLGRSSQFRWLYTQYSQFSSSDTQLLVSGRCEGSQQGGEIIIYNIFIKEFTLQARVRIKPFDVMGTWLNETHILSARAHLLAARRQCLCEVLLNKSSQEIENLMHSTVTRAYMFACENDNTVSYLQVADMKKVISQVYRAVSNDCYQGKIHDMHMKAFGKHKEYIKEAESSMNACKNQEASTPLETVSSITVRISLDKNNVPSESDKIVDRCDENVLSCSARVTNDIYEGTFSNCKKIKLDSSVVSHDHTSLNTEEESSVLLPSVKRCITDFENETDSSNLFSETASPQLTDDELDRDDSESTEVTTGDEASQPINSPSHYKLLLCFTGNDFNVPHQIGIKRIEQEECTDVIRQKFESDSINLQGRPQVRSDNWDHVIEMGGQLVGMSITPCGRYLYVNVRKWDEEVPPRHWARDISSKVTMGLIDLISMEEIATFEGHEAFSDVFFLHISCNDLYVSSGSENLKGYLWDRYYGVLLSTFKHVDVVNCVALNPRDPSMAVSVSDDNSIKIWRSKSFHRLLSSARAKGRMKSVSCS
uniref:F-box/WD repeat-containing protein 5-like n=1 Tax=Styela clava TaxID=7725 RepID=UPI00193A84D5|nr:F-box/WD repeat-containing protein 5-like [Styela clava]